MQCVFTEFGFIRMDKQTLSSTLNSDLPDVTSLNLLDQDSAPKNKEHIPASLKGPIRKVCIQSLKKRVTPVPTERNKMEREGMPLGFPDSVYIHAAAIFQKTNLEKDLAHRLIRYSCISPKGDGGSGDEDDDKDSGIVDDGDANTKKNEHWAYELAFNTLKCEWQNKYGFLSITLFPLKYQHYSIQVGLTCIILTL